MGGGEAWRAERKGLVFTGRPAVARWNENSRGLLKAFQRSFKGQKDKAFKRPRPFTSFKNGFEAASKGLEQAFKRPLNGI